MRQKPPCVIPRDTPCCNPLVTRGVCRLLVMRRRPPPSARRLGRRPSSGATWRSPIAWPRPGRLIRRLRRMPGRSRSPVRVEGAPGFRSSVGATHIIPNHGRGPLRLLRPWWSDHAPAALSNCIVGCEHSVERWLPPGNLNGDSAPRILQGQGADCMLQDGECSRLLIIADGPGVVIKKRLNVVQQTTRRVIIKGSNSAPQALAAKLPVPIKFLMFWRCPALGAGPGFWSSPHHVKIMLWMSASATSGEWPRIVAHTSLGISLDFLPTRPYVNGRSSSTSRA